MKNLPDTFTSRLRLDGDCLIWTGAVDSRGYGHLSVRGKIKRAHRYAFEEAIGPIPRGVGQHGICVMHACDRKLCCNPAHLSLGTHADNMADMQAKGRRKGKNAGAENGRAKLTAAQVEAIRQDARGKRVIAKAYGISPAQAQRIRLGQQWGPHSEPSRHADDD
jgi:hypothetical protein